MTEKDAQPAQGLRNALRRGAGGMMAAAALLAGVAHAAPARAEPAWSELQAPLRGASFGEPGGIALFVLGCGAASGPFIQAPLPEGVRARPGRNAALSLDVDGKRFSARGRIAVDENAEGGPRGAVVAPVRLTDPLVKALGAGKQLKVGEKGGALVVPLDTGTALLGKAIAACGAPAPVVTPAGAKPAAAEAAPKPAEAAPQATAQAAPQATAPATEAAKPARAGTVPPAREIAAAIFVDQAEGQRVADKLKITQVDLSGDGAPEAIITLNDPAWCSETGCTWFVVDLSAKPRVMGQFIGLGLAPGKEVTNGWRDLTLRTPGGTERMYYKDGTYH